MSGSGSVPPPPSSLSLPDSLLTISSVENAAAVYCDAGLKPLLLHAPTETGGCSCGKVHDKSDSGSSSTGKHPIQTHWQKKEFSYDELRDQIARSRFVPNIGIVLGKQPNGEYLIAIDVDDVERMQVLEQELGALPATPRCDSGRGYRLFFSAPREVDPESLQNTTAITVGVSRKEDKISGVDAKVERGQVVVAPSLHANGKRYVWTVAGPVAALPAHWALQLAKKPEVPKFVAKYTPTELAKAGKARKSAERYLEKAVLNNTRALAACTQGRRNDTLYTTVLNMFEYAAGMGQTHQFQWIQDEFLAAAKACGLTDQESRATIASAERRQRETGASKVPKSHYERPGATAAEQRPRTDTIPSATPDDFLTPPLDPWSTTISTTGRPVIQLNTELLQNANAAIVALKTDSNVYQRAGQLVHVTRVTKEEAESSAHEEESRRQASIEGSPQIRNLTRAVIKSRLSHVAIFKKWVNSQNDYKSVLPPDDVVGHIHDVGEYPGIRLLTGVVEAPLFRVDGTIMQTPGYDSTTGYLYIPGCKFPSIGDDIATQEKAQWALEFLKEVFVDFPYVNESHRMVPISAVLTLIARPAILGSVPAVLFDASTRGSGKTLQTDAIAMIATGRCAPRMNYTSDDVELEKILGSYALKGSSFICLDNVPTMRPFGGGPIDRCITARDTLELRVLGRSEVPELRWRALIMATGNNMTLYGDTARRTLMARLEPKEESPEHRTRFKHQNLLEYISKQRPRLVAAALLILRAYWRAGRPNMGCKTWGSFEEWAGLIPNAIVFAGGADPMLARPERDEDVDPETQALSCVLDKLPLLHARMRELFPDQVDDDGLPGRLIVWALYDRTPPLSDFAELRDALELLCKQRGGRGQARPDPTTLGYKFRSLRARVVGGRKLVTKNGEGHSTLWSVERTDGPQAPMLFNGNNHAVPIDVSSANGAQVAPFA